MYLSNAIKLEHKEQQYFQCYALPGGNTCVLFFTVKTPFTSHPLIMTSLLKITPASIHILVTHEIIFFYLLAPMHD